MKRSLFMQFPGLNPPKKTLRWLSMLVSVKCAHGGGLVPLSAGRVDQRPVVKNV